MRYHWGSPRQVADAGRPGASGYPCRLPTVTPFVIASYTSGYSILIDSTRLGISCQSARWRHYRQRTQDVYKRQFAFCALIIVYVDDSYL